MAQTELTSTAIRSVIQAFIDERLQTRLEKLKEDEHEKREQLQNDYAYEHWLADAARRVSQIQQVTHAIKYTHPDAKGTSLYSRGNQAAGEYRAGTHSLGDGLEADVVGNAAALDVYKFLRLSIAGTSILDLVLAEDSRLPAAFSTDDEQAAGWIQAFASLLDSKGTAGSHTLSKQLYWPLDDGGYHLLAPLFPSALSSKVWKTIRDHRFSDDARAARDARFHKQYAEHGYYEYPDIVVQKFGGTKPQNISQLNSERYGENYLLASVPPDWNSGLVRPPFNTDSIFSGLFGRQKRVWAAVAGLRDYLEFYYHPDRPLPDLNNKEIRLGSEQYVQAIIDEFFQFSASVWELEPGWSADEGCNLPPEEQCWLDPQRVYTDEVFATDYRWRDWPDALAARFAGWLNARLASGKKKLPVGSGEALEWRRLLRREINLYRSVED